MTEQPSDPKTYIPDAAQAPASQIGDAFETLAATISVRRSAGEESYTHRLLSDNDYLLKKLAEETGEVLLAAKDLERVEQDATGSQADERICAAQDHLRYEAGDVTYHLLVLLERAGIPLEEFAAELNMRMTADVLAARPGAVRLHDSHINRGK